MPNVKIPKTFYDDHRDRDLPAPPVLRKLARHYVVDAAHPDARELLNDATHYSDVCEWAGAPGASPYIGLQASARATVRALRAGRS